jgi:hypothetical protein
MEDKNKELLEKWHKVVFGKDMETLKSLLSDRITFYSPVVFKPKNTKEEPFLLNNVMSSSEF